MKKVTLNGIDFVKASEVAKEYNYTTDYIGQLCRSKKVNARLVGRSWFVNVPSIEAHRESRHQGIKKEVSQSEVKNVEVESPDSSDSTPKTYLKRVQSPKTRVKDMFVPETGKGKSRTFTSVPLNYEPDDFSLIPTVENKPKVTLLKVSIADSERLKVKSDTRKNNVLRPEPLPEVFLSGKLSVTDIQHEDEVNELNEKSDKRDKSNNIAVIPEVQSQIVSVSKVKTQNPPQASDGVKIIQSKKHSPRALQSAKKPIKPVVLAIHKSNKQISSRSLEKPVNGFVYPALGIATALASALMILAVEQVGYGTSEMINFSLNFSWSNLASLSSFLYTPN